MFKDLISSGAIGALLTIPVGAMAASQAGPEVLEEVIVKFARGEALIGKADAASEGAVGGADLSVRPLLRVAELLEVVPGLIAAQHSGSGKANQYFLRGFNLDHGTDFTTYVDDVPMNLRTHGHGQGYLDINGLIPETIERIDYRKGPYRADVGDFSMAGASLMTTVHRLDPFAAMEVGEYGWQRIAAGGSASLGAGELTAVAQWKTYDGPWQLPEDLQHYSGWAKYEQPTALGNLQVSLSGYKATWDPTEQIPERVIGSAICKDEFCALDRSAVGDTLRWIAAARLTGEDWRASLYGQYYDWHMLSNSTYDFQINQFDRRWIGGGRYEHSFKFGEALSLTSGAEFRHDDIGNVGVAHTEAARFIEYIGRNSVTESSGAIYAEGSWAATDALRVLAGLRGDIYSFDVKQRADIGDTGSSDDTAVSPKLGVAYSVNPNIELYGNWGQGFHSNDVRGVVNTDTPVPAISKGEGKEAGARFEVGNFRLTTTVWWLDLDSELKFVGDSNSVEPGAATQRRGYEVVAFWRPLNWLALDAVWTGSRARFVDSDAGAFVPGAVENAGQFGISAVQNHWEASLRVRHLGAYPLIEDDSVRASPETMINVRAAWKPNRVIVYAEVLNVLGENGKDIVYYYGSNVAGFDPSSDQIDGRMSRAEEPRTVRAGVKFQF
jgi:outer membrane receptor protein involved in Fe transport